jgi:hypothetical protein
MSVYFALLQRSVTHADLEASYSNCCHTLAPNFQAVAWLFVFMLRQSNIFAYLPRDRARTYLSAYSTVMAHSETLESDKAAEVQVRQYMYIRIGIGACSFVPNQVTCQAAGR